MKKTTKKLLAMVLAIVMMLSVIPMSVFAENAAPAGKVISAEIIENSCIGQPAMIAVEVKGSADKIQFIDENNKTITLSRTSENVKGISVNSEGNEIWTVTVKIYNQKQEYKIIAKYGMDWTTDYAKVVILARGVVAANVVKEACIGEYAEVSVEVTSGAYKIMITDSKGGSLTYAISNELVKSIVANEKGNDVWTVKVKVNSAKQEYKVTAKYKEIWTPDACKFSIIAKDITDDSILPVTDIDLYYRNELKLEPVVKLPAGVKYTVSFESSDPSIVKVDENGVVIANGKGSADIKCTITDQNGKIYTDSCTVKVRFTLIQFIMWLFVSLFEIEL